MANTHRDQNRCTEYGLHVCQYRFMALVVSVLAYLKSPFTSQSYISTEIKLLKAGLSQQLLTGEQDFKDFPVFS